MKIYSIFLCLICVLFSACGTSITKEVNDNLAECRNNIFVGNNEYANINFTSGIREEPYVLNGICEQKVEFGVLTVKFLTNIKEYTSEPTYIISVNGNDYDGSLIKNPFDLTYVADINSIVLDDSIMSVKICYENLIIEEDLICISKNWKIKSSDVVEIGVKFFKDKIKEIKNANGLNAEFYVKILYDPNYKLDNYYWYFSIFTKSGQIFSVVIDVNSGELLSQNNI